jgi:STIP1 family protein 1
MNRWNASKRNLQTALDLVSAMNDDKLKVQVEIALKQTKKRLWEEQEKQKEIERTEHHQYLDELITSSFDAKIKEVSLNAAIPESEREEKISQLRNERDERLSANFKLFELSNPLYQKRVVPDFLCCKISFEVMKDPVVTPSGITYERAVITEHLKRVG